MATILIISKQGDGTPVALRLAAEGHTVKMYLEDPQVKHTLDGYENPGKVDSPHRSLAQYDLVLSDMVGSGALCDDLRRKGKLVLGGSSFADKLELDRSYGEKVARSLTQVKLPNSELVRTSKALLECLKEKKAKVVKPFNNKSSSLTLVSNDKHNRTVSSIAKKQINELLPCLVEDKVEGVEISTEGWFNGEKWVLPFNHTIEQKRFMEGDKGSNVGCMGNVVWLTNGDRLTSKVLGPLVPLLKKMNYVGPLDVNCIVSDSNVYFLEYTARFGYEAIQTLSELLEGSLYDFLYRIASGKAGEVKGDSKQVAMGVRLSFPPYPVKHELDKLRGVQCLDIPNEARKHVWLADVMKLDGQEVLAGADGVIGCVTAKGVNVKECQRQVYSLIKRIIICADVQYRSDIGSSVEDDKKRLMKWEWLNS